LQATWALKERKEEEKKSLRNYRTSKVNSREEKNTYTLLQLRISTQCLVSLKAKDKVGKREEK